jgi:poly-gamma-glutamate synthesis protein (capsule biosynthesis protein)
MASSFIPYGAASRSRPDFRGRPGLNPLTLTRRERALVVPPGAAERVRQIGRLLGKDPAKLARRSFRVGARFHLGESFGIEKAEQLAETDRDANLAAIAEAAEKADIVVASIHAHTQERWLREFAGDAIRHGADVVFVHGPHDVRAIELREGKPIFYSMGDFVFEIESIARHPVEAYEKAGLDDDAAPGDIVARARASGRGLLNDARAFEGFVAVLSIADRRLAQLRLLPVDLQFNGSDDRRGRPQRAAPEMSRRIIETVASRSQRYGTRVRFDPATDCGMVDVA